MYNDIAHKHMTEDLDVILKNNNISKFEYLLVKICILNGNNLVLSYWYPFAKMFGNLLDMNCSFILLPICKLFLTKLYNYATDNRTLCKCIKYILNFIPLDKSIQLHKIISFLIFISSIFHTWCHYNCYGTVPKTYKIFFTNYIWLTGILLVLLSFLIFSTSLVAIRHNNYEIFHFIHQITILYFIIHNFNSLFEFFKLINNKFT